MIYLQFCYFVIAFVAILPHLLIALIHTKLWKNKYKHSSSRGCKTKIKAAHRGYINEHPENTIGAIKAAYDNDLIAEIDIEMTSDKQLVVFHDSTCTRMTQSESSLHINTSSYSQLSNVSIPQNIFGMKYKTCSNISLFSDILKAISNINEKTNGIYLDLKRHSRSLFASNVDKLYNKLLIATLNKSDLVRNKNFMFYFASYNPGALYHLLKEWNKYINSNPNDIACQYTFTYYLGAGFPGLVSGFQYLVMKTKVWHFFCPVNSFVCDDGLFHLYYDEIISKYEKDGMKVGFWQKYRKTHKEHAHIQIYNLPQKSWNIVIENGGFSGASLFQDYSHSTAVCLYYVMCTAVAITYAFIFLQISKIWM